MSIPRFSSLVQSGIEMDIFNDDQPGLYTTALLYPTHGEPLLVEVPARFGVLAMNSAYDLDPTLWIGLGTSPDAASFDMDRCAITVSRWPADDVLPLEFSYTVFCAPQLSGAYSDFGDQHPINEAVNALTARTARCWRRNVLVVRSAQDAGGKSRYSSGVSDISERDFYLVNAIVRGYVRLTAALRFPFIGGQVDP
uniref:Uncharacterized protein n=1 Tax=Mycena chlorophos TaxID=658473 RepID=A0ABQ0M7D1_MYCCL|nr:predicted protein [Mycena chlorophos]